MNRKVLFGHVRDKLFSGSLSQQQVDGITRLVNAWQDYWSAQNPWTSVMQAQFAYVLATAYHETGRAMQPVKEKGGNSYFFRMYDIEGDRPHVAKRLGNCEPGDGILFCGRGDVQNTGRGNYQRMGDKLGFVAQTSPKLNVTDTSC